MRFAGTKRGIDDGLHTSAKLEEFEYSVCTQKNNEALQCYANPPKPRRRR